MFIERLQGSLKTQICIERYSALVGGDLDLLDKMQLAEPRQMQAFLHPIRRQLLEQLTRGPATPSAVARNIGISASKAHYHMRFLEKAGLVQLVETRQIGSVTETIFAMVARSFVGSASFNAPSAESDSMLQTLQHYLNKVLEDIRLSLQAQVDHDEGLVQIGQLSMGKPTTEAEFSGYLQSLQKAFEEAQARDAGRRFHLINMLVPMAPIPGSATPEADPPAREE